MTKERQTGTRARHEPAVRSRRWRERHHGSATGRPPRPRRRAAVGQATAVPGRARARPGQGQRRRGRRGAPEGFGHPGAARGALQGLLARREAGQIYCLVEAPSAEAAMAVHREAHGLVANKVREVTGDSEHWAPAPGMKLYLDRHELGAGKVTAKDVAAAHQKGPGGAGEAPLSVPQLLVRRRHRHGDLPRRGAERGRRHRRPQGGARSAAR